ncbi:SDR family oxidoreductase [Bacillus shivajii]|uniref:SDR family NAD(P)-dependent oxidoreductase n=1 Tax=Bacillus shivajii TaxID=1983719 RepID=UPI001CF97955|nr:glucose 1-dehydrogenase [Bacillus shivajii]UCZ54588.1 SDR family oxidoreductase [Bacillus shivajii]
MKLNGKVGIVTGGASGIGEETVKLFLKEGAQVVIADYSNQGEELARSLRVEGHDCYFKNVDVANEEDILELMKETVDRYGKIDIMFANAGIGDAVPAHELTLEEWNKLININLTGVFLSNKYVIEQMRKQGSGGAIINNASILGHVGQMNVTSYAAAKGGVVNLTRSLGVTYAKEGIRVNSVCPGYVKTPLLKEAPKEMLQELTSLHPVGRLGDAEEIAKAVLFLASDDASFIIGENLMVDGGYTAQ